jgi:hypothetical protein
MKRQPTVLTVVILLIANLLVSPAAVSAAPSTPIQEDPPNGATDLPTWVTVRWMHFNPGEVYRVQVATNPQMTALVVNATVSNATGYSLYYVAVKNTTYYWRVNATANGQTSPWSPVWRFTTTNKSAPAPAPTLVSPANGATNIPASTGPTLVWNAVAGAETYDFMIAPEPSFCGAIVQWYAYAGTSKNITGLEEFGESRLYWRVRGRNPGGTGPWSEVRMFTVDLYH